MKSSVPWRVKGIRSDARETAREAARRAGMSVGEWLNSVIIDSADEEGVRLSRRGYRDDDEDDNDQFFGVHERLDELSRHIERLHRAPAQRAPSVAVASGPEAYAPPHYQQNRESQNRDNQLTEAIAQLNRRMDELVNATHTVATARAYAPPPAYPSYAQPPAYGGAPAYQPEPQPVDTWTPDFDQAMAEITARQQALDADPEAGFGRRRAAAPPPQAPEPPPAPPRHYTPPPAAQYSPPVHHEMPRSAPAQREMTPQEPPAPMPTQNLAGLEQQLRHITTQIEALRQQPQLEEGIAALRETLRDMARTLLDATPRRAIEALESEVRSLAARLDDTRQAGVDTRTLTAVERGLAEIHDTLRTLTPAEHIGGFREAVHNLAQKVDMLGASTPDINAFHQLESAISALRGIVSHVASNEALQHLAGEVHALGQKIEDVAASARHATAIDHSSALEILDQRVAHIADALESRVQNGGSVPPQLEAVIQGLTDKIERLQHSRAEDPAFGHLEARVATLLEKLDASGARFAQLEAIERGLADLISYLEKNQQAMQAQGSPQVDGLQRDMVRTQTSLEAVHGTLGHVVNRLAMLESDIREARQQPETPRRSAQAEPPVFAPEPAPQMPPAAQLDVPAPAAPPPVIAKPEAPAEPPLSPAPTREAVASREAAHAQAAAAMARANPRPVRPPIDPNLPPDEPLEPGVGRGRVTASPADRIAASEAALGRAKPPAEDTSKSNFIAAARRAARAAASEPTTADLRAAALQREAEEKTGKSFTQRVRQLFVGASVILIAAGGIRLATNLMNTADAPANTEIASVPAPGIVEAKPPAATPPIIAAAPTPNLDLPPANDVTGSILSPKPTAQAYTFPPSAAQPTTPTETPTSVAPQADKLPAAIGGPSLRMAAASGDAAAEYEIGLRYAEGRGVTTNAVEAVRWLERAAKQGLAMAQFRVAGFYEKGIGVGKDTETARRFYRSAADQGNAKAMHNLAVLYAEGAAVKPDYRTAAQWFRQAADHGVADSQYNLAILYARGIGVDQNLVESYKWFALAAAQGDEDAGRKRDDVAKRLDAASLSTAKLAVKSFQPQSQPEAATVVRQPPGGWDTAAATEAAPAKPKRNGPVRVGAR